MSNTCVVVVRVKHATRVARYGHTWATGCGSMPDNDRSLITLNGEPIPGRIEGSDGMWALRVIGRHIYWPDRRVRSGRVLAYTLDELFDAYLAENVFGCE